MQVNNNRNTMVNLDEQLAKSASKISELNLSNQIENNDEINLTQEIVEQISIPLLYTANAEVISTQDSISKTLLDIKA